MAIGIRRGGGIKRGSNCEVRGLDPGAWSAVEEGADVAAALLHGLPLLHNGHPRPRTQGALCDVWAWWGGGSRDIHQTCKCGCVCRGGGGGALRFLPPVDTGMYMSRTGSPWYPMPPSKRRESKLARDQLFASICMKARLCFQTSYGSRRWGCRSAQKDRFSPSPRENYTRTRRGGWWTLHIHIG